MGVMMAVVITTRVDSVGTCAPVIGGTGGAYCGAEEMTDASVDS